VVPFGMGMRRGSHRGDILGAGIDVGQPAGRHPSGVMSSRLRGAAGTQPRRSGTQVVEFRDGSSSSRIAQEIFPRWTTFAKR